jgi:hypothetical protein
MIMSSFNVRILFEFIWWAVDVLFWFLRIIFDVDAQFHNFLSKDNVELFAAESRLPHGY